MPIHAVSGYLAPMIPLEISAAAVDAQLPDGLRRCAVPQTGDGLHPVLIPLAHNIDTRPSDVPFLTMDYREFSVVIPWVRREESDTPLTYIPILFLDQWMPIMLGRTVYGFPKRFASITTENDRYRALLPSGPWLVDAALEPIGSALPPDAYPHFAPIRTMLGFPIVTHWMGLAWRCSVMDWSLDTAASVQPVQGHLRLSPEFLPGLGREDFDIRGIDTTPLGGFLLRTQWTLTLPGSCGGTAGTESASGAA